MEETKKWITTYMEWNPLSKFEINGLNWRILGLDLDLSLVEASRERIFVIGVGVEWMRG